METYQRITQNVRGALWAHHRRLMPERQYQRILAYVYNNKYEYQVRFDKMTCVGTELGGKIEVATTPAGHIKRVRVNPEFEDFPQETQRKLLVSAFSKAAKEGRDLMQQAEMKVYKQFLRDLKPVVLGIRDNPEFYTVPESSEELPGGTLARSTEKAERTIPYARAFYPSHEFKRQQGIEKRFIESDDGARWLKTEAGKRYQRYAMPGKKPRGEPGAKTTPGPQEILAPYTPMDEGPLKARNWQAFMDNKHVAEVAWTRSRRGDKAKEQRLRQKKGEEWHSPIDKTAEHRW